MKSYQTTFSIKRLWIILSVGMVVMFGILLLLGQQIYQQAPPIPEAVKSQSGETLFTRADIETGQNIWQSIGGMEQGSIWGHGSYLAPDWSADWLHREAEALLALSATPLPAGVSPTQAEAMRKAALQEEMRRNSYDPASGAITVSDTRARAIRQVQQHFVSLYDGGDPASLKLRRDYAFPVYGELSAAEARQLTAFYFWTAWGATTDRPDQTITYTSNWPHEPLVGNSPTTGTLLWSLASVILLLAAAGALIAYYAKQFDVWRGDILPEGGMATSDLL
ncbi:nitric oxide reductase large subunit, partial [Stakelama sediminis]|nr:nitric oxide reductase large subunit [Stakelama sediminis]